MRLNQKVRYAVACLFELSKHLGEYLDANQIAFKQNIPSAYAHKILQVLAHAGLVLALKGAGYQLARPLKEITALEVIESLGKETDPNDSLPDMGFRFEQRINQALSGLTMDEVMMPR
jgi:Rrf2 family protein